MLQARAVEEGALKRLISIDSLISKLEIKGIKRGNQRRQKAGRRAQAEGR